MPDDTNIETVLAIDAAVLRSTGAATFGVTRDGFVPKPFARLLAEKLALGRALFGDDLDLGSGSAIRKLLEISALEDARTWAALATMYDNQFVTSAGGEALGRLGEELGFPRPHLEARGTIKLRLQGTLPAGFSPLVIPRGARLLTAGGHHVATDDTIAVSADTTERTVPVVAFYPGPEHNLNPAAAAADGSFPQRISNWNSLDESLQATLIAAVEAAAAAGAPIQVLIEHTQALAGGELQWPDTRYRQLLLQAPRSVWTVDALRVAASLVPGVRQVVVRDRWGGLDIDQSIFGNFNFIERLFSSERELGSPYYCTVLVAPTPAAIWEGADGLRVSVESAIEDLRPVGIFPRVEKADEVSVGLAGELVVRGVALPTGSATAINASPAAQALKRRLLERVRRYVDALPFGEPVRAAEVTWGLMNEPGVVDVKNLKLVRYPPRPGTATFGGAAPPTTPEELDCGHNVELQVNQIAVFVDDAARLVIV